MAYSWGCRDKKCACGGEYRSDVSTCPVLVRLFILILLLPISVPPSSLVLVLCEACMARGREGFREPAVRAALTARLHRVGMHAVRAQLHCTPPLTCCHEGQAGFLSPVSSPG